MPIKFKIDNVFHVMMRLQIYSLRQFGFEIYIFYFNIPKQSMIFKRFIIRMIYDGIHF